MDIPAVTMTDSAAESVGLRTRVSDHLAIAVGTADGLFLVSDGIVAGSFFLGGPVTAFVQVGQRCVAAAAHPRSGAVIHTSDDAGMTWSEPATGTFRLPEDSGVDVARVAQLTADLGKYGDAGALLAGVEPGALFSSSDGGASFQLVRGLWDHSDRELWAPGCGGVTLDTVLTHPDRPGRIIVAISGGGVYRSEDGGRVWAARNSGIRTGAPGATSENGICVHKVALEAANPDVLWAQTHEGVYRSEDAGDEWVSVDRVGLAGGLPSDFGYPIVTDPGGEGSVFVFPMASREHPFDCEVFNRPYKTTDRGRHWSIAGHGVPTGPEPLTVVADALAVGSSPPFSLVFGTLTGEVFASADNGETWRSVISEVLPAVLFVRVLD